MTSEKSAEKSEKYTMVDVPSLAARAADLSFENKQTLSNMKPEVERLVKGFDVMEAKLDLALKPTIVPLYVKVSAPVIAIALVILAYVTVVRSASAWPEPVTHVSTAQK
jgi:hypothetical protein